MLKQAREMDETSEFKKVQGLPIEQKRATNNYIIDKHQREMNEMIDKNSKITMPIDK